MLCLKCQKETPDTQSYCHHCGAKLDLTFEEVTEKLREDIKDESVKETELFFRWLLLFSIALLIISLYFKSLWTNPPMPDISAGYVPTIEVEEYLESIHNPIIIIDTGDK